MRDKNLIELLPSNLEDFKIQVKLTDIGYQKKLTPTFLGYEATVWYGLAALATLGLFAIAGYELISKQHKSPMDLKLRPDKNQQRATPKDTLLNHQDDSIKVHKTL